MIALITGATSGFGKAIAERMSALGYDLIITGRRNDRLQKLTQDISREHEVKVTPLCFDIQDKNACRLAFESLPEEMKSIDLLVNNAGLASTALPFQESNMEDLEQMIDTNVKGLLYMTQLVVPHMIEHKKGHIINISSIAGIEVYPNGSVYCASKHAVNAITKGLRLDLIHHGIKVSSVSPGMADTEFSVVRFHGDKNKAEAVYAGLVPLSADDIADAVEFIVNRPAHVSINDIQINPVQQANTYISHRDQTV